jgi:septal ring factor EnvC (AmiA/AmiB activator)
MERLELRRLSIDNLSGEQIAVYLENVELDDDTRALLEQVLELQTRIAALTRSVAQERQRVDQIFQDQDRIRQNMAALDRASDLYARYVRELEAQEDLLAAVWDRCCRRA